MNLTHLAIITSLVGSSFLVQADEEKYYSQQYDATSQSRLSVVNVNGDVTIKASNDDTISIEAFVTANNSTCIERIKVEFEQSSDSVQVTTRYEKDSNHKYNRCNSDVKYEISMPDYVAIKQTKLVNGNLRVDNIVAPISAKLVNGNADVKGARSNVSMHSVNGEINIAFAESYDNLDNIELETVNGKVNLMLTEQANLMVSAKTVSGSISNEFGIPVNKSGYVGQRMKGEIGNGSGMAHLSSVNGSIAIIKQ